MEGLAPHRLEEAVGDEGVDFRVEHEGVHADRPVKGGGPVLRFGGRRFAPDHLDEGEQIDGNEGVADEDPLGRRAAPLEPAREEARGRGGDDRFAGRGPARGREEGALHLLALGHALLDQGGARDRLFDARHDLDAPGGDGRREGEPGVGAGRVRKGLVEPGPGVRVRVVDADVDAVHREPRRPPRSDDPGPEEGDPPEFAHPAALTPDACKRMLQTPIPEPRAVGPRPSEWGSSRPRAPRTRGRIISGIAAGAKHPRTAPG